MKNYTVRLWYTWYKDIDVVADDPENAWEKARNVPVEEIFDGFSVGDLEYDTDEIFGGEEE